MPVEFAEARDGRRGSHSAGVAGELSDMDLVEEDADDVDETGRASFPARADEGLSMCDCDAGDRE